MSLYLRLWHGRKKEWLDIDDLTTVYPEGGGWGLDGPVFGPLSFVHTTYGAAIYLGEPGPPYDTLGELNILGGMAYYDGIWYGDWLVVTLRDMGKDLRKRIELFDPEKAECPPEVLESTRL